MSLKEEIRHTHWDMYNSAIYKTCRDRQGKLLYLLSSLGLFLKCRLPQDYLYIERLNQKTFHGFICDSIYRNFELSPRKKFDKPS